MQSHKRKAHILLPIMCAATLSVAGISLAAAAGNAEQSDEGMHPKKAANESVGSSKTPKQHELSNASESSLEDSPDVSESDHGMEPNDRGTDTSVDSASIPEHAGDTERDNTDGAKRSSASPSEHGNSEQGMEPNEEGKGKSIDSGT